LGERKGSEDKQFSIAFRPLMKATRMRLFCCSACARLEFRCRVIVFLSSIVIFHDSTSARFERITAWWWTSSIASTGKHAHSSFARLLVLQRAADMSCPRCYFRTEIRFTSDLSELNMIEEVYTRNRLPLYSCDERGRPICRLQCVTFEAVDFTVLTSS
jgi:hypothetical protein